MEDPLSSIFNYQQSSEDLRQKLLETTLELETMKNVKAELLNLLKMAYHERDEAREQLRKLVKKITPPTSNVFVDVPPENLVMVPTTTKANSSITESNSHSHVSSPVDSLVEAGSSPEFSNINVVESHNLGYLNPPLSGSVSPALAPSDLATTVIDYLAKGKVLPQKGKLLEAVMDAGPLLQTLIVAGPLPTWRNPPTLQGMKIPPLMVKDFASNSCTLNLRQKPTTIPSSHLSPPCMLNNINIAAISSASRNNAWHLSSNAGCKGPSRIPQSHHQYLL